MKIVEVSSHTSNKVKAVLLGLYTIGIHLLAIIGASWIVVTVFGPF